MQPKTPIVVADQFVEILVASLIPRIETETDELVESHRADEIFAHAHGAAPGDATAAFDAGARSYEACTAPKGRSWRR